MTTPATTPAITWTIADSATKNNEDGSTSLILTLRATKTMANGTTLHAGQFVHEIPSPSSSDIAGFVNKATVVLSIALPPAASPSASGSSAPASNSTTAASS